MVPYSSASYVEHVFKLLSIQSNQKASTSQDDINSLIKAAEKLRDLVKEMEDAEDITGFIVYTTESEAELRKKREEE